MRTALALVALSALSLSLTVTRESRAAGAKSIRWVLAHEPVGLFEKAARHFAAEVERNSQGQLRVEVLTVEQYAQKYGKGHVNRQADVVRLIQNGDVEMSQTYTTSLGAVSSEMFVLDLPFLFRNHAHAQKVLEGQPGQTLLASLERGNLHGLAFTYSGGYRVIPANKPLRNVDDFKGLSIRTSGSPVARDTFLALGATPKVMELEQVGSAVKRGDIESAESTYPRFYSMRQNEFSRVVNDTQHSLFLTSIVVNKPFWDGLGVALQKTVTEAAVSAARLERQESIVDAEKTRAQCLKEGIAVVELTAAETQRFKDATRSVYDKYKTYFRAGLIADIQAE